MSNYVEPGYVEPKYFQTGITIIWGTKTIFVPKSETTLIQSTPTEIRELDLNLFRLALKDLEDSEEGMSFPSTHNHNTTVVLSGLTLARVIEIINGYTVTFEDGLYAVNLVGANSNVGDVVNVNKVSVRTSNSAGLIVSTGTVTPPAPTAAEVALAVWNEPAIDHTASGTTGLFLNQIKADTSSVSISVIALQSLVNTMLKYERNRTKIDTDLATLTIFDDDGITPLTVFNLKDHLGNLSVAEVCERLPQ